jgi:uncharacterized protein
VTSPLSGLVVNVAEVLRRVGNVKEIDVAVDSDLLDLDDERIARQDVPVAFHLESTNTGIMVRGKVSAEFHDTCRRCLSDVRDTLSVLIAELYQREITDPDAYPLEGEQLLLGPLVREHLLLALPDAAICRADCPGLCPVCGADKSDPVEADCGCAVGVADPRWAALDALRDRLDDR